MHGWLRAWFSLVDVDLLLLITLEFQTEEGNHGGYNLKQKTTVIYKKLALAERSE